MNPDQPDVRMVLWLQNNKMKGTRDGQQQIALKSPEFHPNTPENIQIKVWNTVETVRARGRDKNKQKPC